MATCLDDHSFCKDLICCDQEGSEAPEQEQEQQCEVSLAVDGFRTPSRKRNYGDMTGGEESYSESVEGHLELNEYIGESSQQDGQEKLADVYIPGSASGREAAVDVSIVSPLQRELSGRAAAEVGSAAAKRLRYGEMLPFPPEEGQHLHQQVDEVHQVHRLGGLKGDVSDEQVSLRKIKSKAEKLKTKKVNKNREAYRKCPWSKNHTSKASLKQDKTILNLPVLDQFGIPSAGLQVITRRSYQDMLQNKKENVVDKTDKMLLQVIKDISKRLGEEVFSEEGEQVIEKTRIILDLPTLALKIKHEKSSVKVAAMEFEKWYEAMDKIPVEDLANVPKEELKSQYKIFVARLEEATRKLTVKELKDLDSKVLLKRFFDPVGLLYKDAELIMHAMAVASVKSSCEYFGEPCIPVRGSL